MNLKRGYGLARAIFEKESNLSFYTPKPYQILSKYAQNEIEKKIIEELFLALESGALCLDLDFLKESLNTKIELQEELLKNLEEKHNIIFVNNKFYFKNTYETEKLVGEKISLLLDCHTPDLNFSLPEERITYSKEQIQAIQNVLKQRFSVITGGPGTGKTTVIRGIVWNLLQNGYEPKKIQLASPTGKAAKRLSESLENLAGVVEPPSTLHRLLGYNPNTGKFFYNEENPLSLDVLIIDEASMLDLYIFKALMTALLFTPKLKVILVGDPDQLLSVNKGAIFSDLVSIFLEQKRDSISELTSPYRQKQENIDLLELIESVRKGKFCFIRKYKTTSLEINSSVKFIELEEEDNFFEYLKAWYKIYKGLNSQILTPFNKGKLGVNGINNILISEFSEESPRILNTNLNSLQIFNGETGYIWEENGNYFFSKTFHKSSPISIPYYVLKHFSLAYAITIHKSQGSEYEHVCLVLPTYQKLNSREEILTKRLIYTAITRAKKSVTIIGSFATWKEGIQNLGYPRMSGLREIIRE